MHDNRQTKLRREQIKPQTKQSKILKKKISEGCSKFSERAKNLTGN